MEYNVYNYQIVYFTKYAFFFYLSVHAYRTSKSLLEVFAVSLLLHPHRQQSEILRQVEKEMLEQIKRECILGVGDPHLTWILFSLCSLCGLQASRKEDDIR